MKPYPVIFNFALSATQSELNESIMIGDSWEADIIGANGTCARHVVTDLAELEDVLS